MIARPNVKELLAGQVSARTGEAVFGHAAPADITAGGHSKSRAPHKAAQDKAARRKGARSIMTSKRYMTIPMVAGALGVGGAAMVARAAEPTTAELQAQIQSLQTKVQQLESQSPAQQQKTATVDSVLSDANKRSQLMQVEGFTAGHTGGDDGHFVVQSGDGNFRMVPWLQLQFRTTLTYE